MMDELNGGVNDWMFDNDAVADSCPVCDKLDCECPEEKEAP